ncbi:MAG: nucleotide sugar dehydrogenase [Eubacteriales bacterium]|nr:nucleotide sugar dehydrogenase [Eubacteriales bacterium]
MVYIKRTVAIIGLGYIGLPTAAMFATHGHSIIGVDLNKKVVDPLNSGEITIEEPGLDKIVKEAVVSGNLRGSTSPTACDAYVIAVGTPINEDKTADLKAVISAAKSITPLLKKGDIVVLESTCPPGTVTDVLVPILSKSGLDIYKDVYVAHCPERVLPGKILNELVENNKIIGGLTEESCEAVKELYSSFVKGDIILTDATTAEMCKLMENTFRDVNIALANELTLICEKLGINAWEVIRLSNKHPRVNLHSPGPGVGGHCIAVDPWFIVEKQPELSRIIKLSRKTNDGMPAHVHELALAMLTGSAASSSAASSSSASSSSASSSSVSSSAGKKKIVIMGITYKPNIDDIRESPILKLIELFRIDNDIELAIYDPHVKGGLTTETDLYKAAEGSSLVILGVNHNEFAAVDFQRLKSVMKEHNILDTRNFWDGQALKALGFNYYLLGEGTPGGLR